MNDKTSGGWGEGVLSTFGRFNERGCRGGCCPLSADSKSGGGAVHLPPIQRAGGGGGGGGGSGEVAGGAGGAIAPPAGLKKGAAK